MPKIPSQFLPRRARHNEEVAHRNQYWSGSTVRRYCCRYCPERFKTTDKYYRHMERDHHEMYTPTCDREHREASEKPDVPVSETSDYIHPLSHMIVNEFSSSMKSLTLESPKVPLEVLSDRGSPVPHKATKPIRPSEKYRRISSWNKTTIANAVARRFGFMNAYEKALLLSSPKFPDAAELEQATSAMSPYLGPLTEMEKSRRLLAPRATRNRATFPFVRQNVIEPSHPQTREDSPSPVALLQRITDPPLENSGPSDNSQIYVKYYKWAAQFASMKRCDLSWVPPRPIRYPMPPTKKQRSVSSTNPEVKVKVRGSEILNPSVVVYNQSEPRTPVYRTSALRSTTRASRIRLAACPFPLPWSLAPIMGQAGEISQ